MNIVFHYDCIKALARSAGLEEDEAQTIAYASQYVDDGQGDQYMTINDLPPVALPLKQGDDFYQVQTAHSTFEMATDGFLRGGARRAVYISFHFVPKKKPALSAADCVVLPDCSWAGELLTAAKADVLNESSESRLPTLIRLGVITHSYADTWSHQGFAGLHDGSVNDVHDCQFVKDGTYVPLTGIRSPFPIGHGMASTLPDESQTTWRYRPREDAEFITRNNTDEFMKPAEVIFRHFCDLTGQTVAFDSIRDRVQACLALGQIENSHGPWLKAFPGIKFAYDKDEWQNAALEPVEPDYSEPSADSSLTFNAKGDLRWFYFHLAALQQRKAIMGQIRC
ncbi:MAG: DUF6765 family protein [Planctomycetota bacterium]